MKLGTTILEMGGEADSLAARLELMPAVHTGLDGRVVAVASAVLKSWEVPVVPSALLRAVAVVVEGLNLDPVVAEFA